MANEQVNIDSLGIEQLTQVKKQLEEEVEHLGSSFAQLHAAQAKFKDCLRCVEARSASSGDAQSVLVPLTNSLYVRGDIPKTDQVMVDIGTGYLLQKSTGDARTFYQSKVEGLTKTLQQVEGVLQQKTGNIRAIDDVIRKKMATTAPPQED